MEKKDKYVFRKKDTTQLTPKRRHYDIETILLSISAWFKHRRNFSQVYSTTSELFLKNEMITERQRDGGGRYPEKAL